MKTSKLRTVSWYTTRIFDYDPDEHTRVAGTRVWLDDRLSGLRLRVLSRELNVFWI